MVKMKRRQNIHKYSYSVFLRDVESIIKEINKRGWRLHYVYGPPRGGCILAVFLSHKLNLKYLSTLKEKHIPGKTLLVDDVSDTGNTLKNIKNINKYKTVTIYVKPGTCFIPNIHIRDIPRKYWITYWWEKEY